MITTTSSSKPYIYFKKNSILVVHVFSKRKKEGKSELDINSIKQTLLN